MYTNVHKPPLFPVKNMHCVVGRLFFFPSQICNSSYCTWKNTYFFKIRSLRGHVQTAAQAEFEKVSPTHDYLNSLVFILHHFGVKIDFLCKLNMKQAFTFSSYFTWLLFPYLSQTGICQGFHCLHVSF